MFAEQKTINNAVHQKLVVQKVFYLDEEDTTYILNIHLEFHEHHCLTLCVASPPNLCCCSLNEK